MFEACQISTGDILRKAVAEQSPLGREAAGYINSGALVPDGVILNLVAEQVKAKDCQKGFLLDGFPRTVAQAEGLEQLLKPMGLHLDCVLSVQVPQQIIVERLSGRRTCRDCGAMYHVVFGPSKKDGVCDKCGGQLYQRDDDRQATIEARLKVYETQTTPLISYYRERGLLRDVNGVGSIDEIRSRVVAALGDLVK
jgi:adenylate kinase